MSWMLRFILGFYACFLTPLEPSAKLTWYGGPYVGQHHAAYWHGETPKGFPDVVTLEDLGVAAPYEVPFGTVVRITRIGHCAGYNSELDGRSVYAVVVDRLGQNIPKHYDAFPATFQALGTLDEGCLRVRVEVLVPHN